jgi:hypothetical protein
MAVTAEDADQRDHAQAMIDWLAERDSDVWFEVAPHLNWDSSFRVLDWIISHPRSDKAAAAFVFWAADPLCCAPHRRRRKLGLRSSGSDTALSPISQPLRKLIEAPAGSTETPPAREK